MGNTKREYTLFVGNNLIVTGKIETVLTRSKEFFDQNCNERIALFDDTTGNVIDVDYRGTLEDVLSRLPSHPMFTYLNETPVKKAGPGRPKLGVISKEITLLPRHWEWLGEQQGGASVTLRKLVEKARKESAGSDNARRALEAIGRFISDMAGDLPDYEEVTRAYYAKNWSVFEKLIVDWPEDIKEYVMSKVNNLIQLEKLIVTES
jgi:uncharacterized protein